MLSRFTMPPVTESGRSRHRLASPVAWSRRHELVWLLICGASWRVSSRASLLVGTVLTLVNQGDHLFAGDVDVVTAAQVLANYTIPYVVAGVGFLSGYRTPAAGDATR